MSAEMGTIETPIIASAGLSTPVSVANGGTGSATQSFVDLTTVQNVGGAKTFTSAMAVQSTLSTTGNIDNGAIKISTNGTIDAGFSGGQANIACLHNNTTAFNLNNRNSGDVYCNLNTTATKAITFPLNSGFPFATTLSPSGTTQTVDWATGASQKINAASTTGTLVLTFSNPVDGGRYVVKTLGKTARVWTFPSSVKWAAGSAPTVTAVDGTKDAFEFFYDAGDSTYIGRIVAQNVS